MLKLPKVACSYIAILLCCICQQSEAQTKVSPMKAALPIPMIPSPGQFDSLPMGDWNSFAEVKLGVPIFPGPFKPTWESIEANYPGTPAWLRDAKFGIWVHFGPQASGASGDWYARKMYTPGTPAYKNHLEKNGHPSEFGYKEILRDWNPTQLDPAKLAKIYKDAGARFLMIQGVHHDNYDLWNSRYQPWNSVNIGPKRDLLGEWAKACVANNIRYGITFHHEYTWWWWQTAFGSDTTGVKKGIPYDGSLRLADGKGKWWEGYDPRMLYGIDLREYKGVAEKSHSPWSPPSPGIFSRHLDYAKWYANNWALRMMDVVENYNPDFIYTDGTVQGPFTGNGTGTGYKADAMQSVIADYYNRTLKHRGKVNTFSIVKFRDKTNGTVTTEEFAIPDKIKTDQAWIAEAPVGDWYYAPDFTYDSGMMIRYVTEAIARDGNAALCISLLPDGSLDEGSLKMLKEVGVWMRRNGEAVYGSHAWKIPGEGELIKGKLKMLPGGALRRKHADFKFGEQDFRFTVGKNGALYVFSMMVPETGDKLKIKSLGSNESYLGKTIKKISMLGYKGKLQWKQQADGLIVTCPPMMPYGTSVVFKIE
ncbi:alpha-L-fucosidase [Pedobacter sp. MC2016-05]|uniref:alpha-L-fucosidase n=1 Tax=Pedobacter sp. MC2016-05 TaxID=2994474 RepID=UPI0022486C01|nr:alpha-L-fucosidase [Pedobacter sp. MC2016-05]MCX2473490.1 alpha-L-fucosidase [Pedobacter sp. MC2016-05]